MSLGILSQAQLILLVSNFEIIYDIFFIVQFYLHSCVRLV